MRLLTFGKDVETVEVNPIIFRKLTREDWLHIVDVCDKSLEKYNLRLKKWYERRWLTAGDVHDENSEKYDPV